MTEDSRSAILSTAARLFVERGYAGTSLADIAAAAGVTKSLIHHHFASKNGLWQVFKDAVAERYGRELAATLARSPTVGVPLLRESLGLYFEHLRANPEAVRMLAWLYLEGDTASPELEAELLERGSERLAEGQAAGRFRADLRPGLVLAVAICAMERWLQHRDVFQPLVPDLEGAALDDAFRDTLFALLAEGLVPRPPAGA